MVAVDMPDKIGAYVKEKPVRPQEFSATIYHALGVPFESRITKDGLSRPLSTGEPLLEFELHLSKQA